MELLIDNFAGGGGASTGIEAALNRPVDIAINHDPVAIAMHKVNHPDTLHLNEDVWRVDPVEVCGGRPVGLAWFSPDCTHFSKAKGGKPVKKKIRGLAWVVLKLSRGQVWCLKCGRTQKVESGECLRHGWPECCGETMTIDDPEERR